MSERPIQTAASSQSDVLLERTGMMIGRYKLLQQIGEGGFGVVFMAEQTEPVQRKVALKIVKAGMDTREIIARFEAERQALALMDHPNIAKVLDAGATAGGRPYFVMELVRGVPLTDYCDHAKLSTRERLELFIKVCHAVQHAHQKGVIHRDLKPGNVLVTLHDGEPVPKVIDFGVAKALGQKLTGKTLFTRFEQMIGTPAYMSPEQAALGGLDIDTRSDIYSLGVLLYELLTGVTPLDQETLRQGALDEIRRMIRETDPPKPSTRLLALGERLLEVARCRHADAASLSRLVRGDLDWITMKALEKDRRRRYETVSGLVIDLERHLNNEPVEARPPSAVYRFQKLVRRNKLACTAVGAVIASLLAGLSVFMWQFAEKNHLLKRTLLAEKEATAQAGRANQNAAQEIIHRHRAEAAAQEVRNTLAASDFFQATRLISEDQCAAALAYLHRSVSLNPTNAAAVTRLTTLLSQRAWMVPVLSLKHVREVTFAQFSLDGKRIVAASGPEVQVWDAQSGQALVGPLKHAGLVSSAQFSPDGTRIVTASHDGTARVWDGQNGQPLTQPLKHFGEVYSAQFSSDGKLIVTVSWEGVRVWDAQKGQPVSELLGYAVHVNSAQFSPDGKQIVTAGRDGTVRVWDAQTGHRLGEPFRHFGEVDSAQFSPDGRQLVTASGTEVRVWDAQSGQELVGPLKHTGQVTSAQFSLDGTRIVTASRDNTARVWDARSGRPLTAPLAHSARLNSARFSPDGRRIITASDNGTARVWDAQMGQPLIEPLLHRGPVNSAQFSPDGRRLLTASNDGTVRVWDSGPGQQFAQPLRHSKSVNSATFSPDSKRIVTASDDGTARVWDAKTGRPLTDPLKHGDKVSFAQFSPDGSRVVTACCDNTVRVWDARSGQPVTGPLKMEPSPDQTMLDAKTGQRVTKPLKAELTSVQLSPDGKRIVIGSSDGTARVWDAETGQPLTEPLRHLGGVFSAQFSPDGKRIVTASWDQTARVWDAQSGQSLTPPLKHTGPVQSAQFSPDGRRVVTASHDKTARVWDAQSGQPLTGPLRHSDVVFSAQFSPDGKRIVTACWDRAARVWDAQSGQLLIEPFRHRGLVRSAQFSPDGTRIGTASWDQTARVWDAQNGQPLTDPLNHAGAVLSAQFSPDGKRVVTASWDQTARVWDIAPSSAVCPAWLLELAEAISGQVLDNNAVLQPTKKEPLESLNRVRQALAQGGQEDWSIWGRWFLADPATRTISPFSSSLVSEYMPNRIEEPSAELIALNEQLAYSTTKFLFHESESIRTVKQLRQAELLVGQGKLTEAEALYRDALVQLGYWSAPDPTGLAGALAEFATLLLDLQKFSEAETPARECLSIREKILASDDLLMSDARFLVGASLFGQGKHAEAEPFLLAAYEGIGQATSSRRAAALALLAKLYDSSGRSGHAAELAVKPLEGADPKQAGDDMNRLAWSLATSRREQERDGNTALVLAERAVSATSRTNFMFLDTLAAAYAESGKFARAVAAEKEALAFMKDTDPKAEFASRLKLYESNTPYREARP